MVSAGVCFGCKGRLHFVEEKAKVDCAYMATCLLPNLVEDCNHLLPAGFIFQQDGTPAHTARSAQNWLRANSPDFITKDQWPPNSPDLNPMDYHVGVQCWRLTANLKQSRKNNRQTQRSASSYLGQPAMHRDRSTRL